MRSNCRTATFDCRGRHACIMTTRTGTSALVQRKSESSTSVDFDRA